MYNSFLEYQKYSTSLKTLQILCYIYTAFFSVCHWLIPFTQNRYFATHKYGSYYNIKENEHTDGVRNQVNVICTKIVCSKTLNKECFVFKD